jgi:hypothetical protein
VEGRITNQQEPIKGCVILKFSTEALQMTVIIWKEGMGKRSMALPHKELMVRVEKINLKGGGGVHTVLFSLKPIRKPK